MLVFKIVLIVALVVWLVAMIAAYQYGRIGRLLTQTDKTLSAVNSELPAISVIIAAHNQAGALRRHLPVILSQDYARFEVIVVDMASTDDTKDVLERLELQNAKLRHTFTPSSARDISIERLALTLGFRAAIHEWVVITYPDCEPLTDQWLTRIGETIIQPQEKLQSPLLKAPDIVLGLARFDEQRSTLLDMKTGFFRMWNNLACFHHILNGHSAVRADGCNLAFRKSYFLESGGFADAQDLKAGAAELLVNHTSTPTNTALLMSPSAYVVQERIGSERQWEKQRVFYAETRRHQRHATLYRVWASWMLLMPWLAMFCIVIPLVGCIIFCLSNPESETSTQQLLTIGLMALLLITYIISKITWFQKTTQALGLRSYNLTFILFELQIPLWNLSARLSRRLTSRNEFRKKFV